MKKTNNIYYLGILACFTLFLLASCQKWKDKKGEDPGLTNHYCNNPNAVNYNWGFPGIPDSTVCYYPSDLFKGGFAFTDSVFLPDNTLSSIQNYTLQLTASTRENFTIAGICPGNALHFTANRYGMATADTLITNGAGQLMCREVDTLIGQISRSTTDSNALIINFTVMSDTGTTYHIGTAYKQ